VLPLKRIGRKFSGEGEATEKRPKIAKKTTKNSTIKSLPGEGGGGQRKKKEKKTKKNSKNDRKIALLSFYLQYLCHV